MSKGPMESNKEEMRVAEVVEEVVDSKEEGVTDFKDAKGLGDPWERISGTEVAVKIASDEGESILSMVSKDRMSFALIQATIVGRCCTCLFLTVVLSHHLTSYTARLGDINFALEYLLKYKQCS